MPGLSKRVKRRKRKEPCLGGRCFQNSYNSLQNPAQDDHEAGDMKETTIDRERTVVTHDQAPVVAEPADGSFHDPATPVAPESAPVLGRRALAVPVMWRDQFDATLRQPFAQRIAVVTPIGDHPLGLLSRTT